MPIPNRQVGISNDYEIQKPSANGHTTVTTEVLLTFAAPGPGLRWVMKTLRFWNQGASSGDPFFIQEGGSDAHEMKPLGSGIWVRYAGDLYAGADNASIGLRSPAGTYSARIIIVLAQKSVVPT